jgi:hypothetical protein
VPPSQSDDNRTVRKFVAAGLIGLCLAIATASVAERAVPFRTVARGGESMAVTARPANLVIRDRASWKRLWRQLHAGDIPQPAVPRVDFSLNMLIAVRQGPSSSGGYDIRITSIVDDGRRLLVAVEARKPGANCVMPAVITAPYHVVRIRRSAKPAVFKRHLTVYDC